MVLTTLGEEARKREGRKTGHDQETMKLNTREIVVGRVRSIAIGRGKETKAEMKGETETEMKEETETGIVVTGIYSIEVVNESGVDIYLKTRSVPTAVIVRGS